MSVGGLSTREIVLSFIEDDPRSVPEIHALVTAHCHRSRLGGISHTQIFGALASLSRDGLAARSYGRRRGRKCALYSLPESDQIAARAMAKRDSPLKIGC